MAAGIARILQELLNRPSQPQLTYDPMRFARPGPWITYLNPQQEADFRAWLKESGSEKDPRRYFDPTAPKSDYDMRGFGWRCSAVIRERIQGSIRWLGDQLIDTQSGRVLFDDRKKR